MTKTTFLLSTNAFTVNSILPKSKNNIYENLRQEVYNMTEPVLRLRSDKYWEAVHENKALQKIIDDQKHKLDDKDNLLADQKVQLSELAEYKRIYGELNPSQIKK